MRSPVDTLGDRLADPGLTLVTDHRDAEGDMCWRFASLSFCLATAAVLQLARDTKVCPSCPTPEEIQDADSGGVCVTCGASELPYFVSPFPGKP